MKVNLPSKVRLALYILTALGNPIVIYLAAVNVLGEKEVALWLAENAVIGTLAAFNTNTSEEV